MLQGEQIMRISLELPFKTAEGTGQILPLHIHVG
jgi:hypothetical protein